jgi:hypothetical protein
MATSLSLLLAFLRSGFAYIDQQGEGKHQQKSVVFFMCSYGSTLKMAAYTVRITGWALKRKSKLYRALNHYLRSLQSLKHSYHL